MYKRQVMYKCFWNANDKELEKEMVSLKIASKSRFFDTFLAFNV